MRVCFKYYFLLAVYLVCSANSFSQGGYGQPVFKQDFGPGNNDPATIGVPLAPGKSDFTFSNAVCPPPGSYTIIRRVPVANCFNSEWIPLSHDNNPFIPLGMMMVVNNNSSAANRIIYKDTVTAPLCPGELYYCSAAVINLDTIGGCPSGPDFPVMELRVETESGQVLSKDTTRPWIGYATPPPFGYKFAGMGIYFIMPGGVSKLVIKLTLLRSVYECAEDFAIDDVEIKSVGPAVTIGFEGEPNTTIVKTTCFQDNKTVTLNGNMDDYYPNPILQWQLSLDSGATWTDIPGANAATYSKSYSVPGLFYYRLSGGDATTIANPNCRVISNVVWVRVDGLPKNYLISNNSPVCAGQDLKFKAEGAASYIWTGPNGFSDNINAPHIFFASLKDSGTYYVQVFSLGGCNVTDSTHVTVVGTDVDAYPDTAICRGGSVRLNVNEGASYFWSPADGLSSATVRKPLAKPEKTTTYTVKLTDRSGCSDTAQVTLVVKNKIPVVAAIESNGYVCRPLDSIQFKDISSGVITKILWDFGNGNTSTEKIPPIQYYRVHDGTQSFTVHLSVTDSGGCKGEAVKLLQAVNLCNVAVPSAFTPNNDGLNDYLYPLNAYKVTNLLFRVYNRTGKKVFETRELNRGWDGNVKNIPQETGIYIWVLAYKDIKGKPVSLKGTTALIR